MSYGACSKCEAPLARSFTGFRTCPKCSQRHKLSTAYAWFYGIVGSLMLTGAVLGRAGIGGGAVLFWVVLPLGLVGWSATLPAPRLTAP